MLDVKNTLIFLSVYHLRYFFKKNHISKYLFIPYTDPPPSTRCSDPNTAYQPPLAVSYHPGTDTQRLIDPCCQKWSSGRYQPPTAASPVQSVHYAVSRSTHTACLSSISCP